MQVTFTTNRKTALVLQPDDGADEVLIAALLRFWNQGGQLVIRQQGKIVAKYNTTGYAVTDYDTAKAIADYTGVLDPVEDDDG